MGSGRCISFVALREVSSWIIFIDIATRILNNYVKKSKAETSRDQPITQISCSKLPVTPQYPKMSPNSTDSTVQKIFNSISGQYFDRKKMRLDIFS